MVEIQSYIQLFILGLLSIIAIRAILKRKHNKSPSSHPPSPLALPIIGHLHLLSKLPHQSFHNLSNKYGPIMRIFLGSMPCVVISNPQIVKDFLKTHDTSFSNRFKTAAGHYITYGSKGFVFAPYGEYWKFIKKLCMSELLGGRTINRLLPLRQQETLRFLRLLQKKGEAGEAVDIGNELLTLTNSIITRMIMSRTCGENDDGVDAEEIRKMVKDTSVLAGKFDVRDFIWFCKNLDLQGMDKRLKEILERFDAIMERVISEHEEERKRRKENGETDQNRDILDILLEIHEDDDTEVKLTRVKLKAFILDIFMAGTETTAITIEWALAELINNPHEMKKAREEIDSLTGKTRLIEESDLSNLPYLRAIVKESLRLHPSTPIIVRESTESCNVCGYDIPAKTALFVNLWSMGRDPNSWENPHEFRPERFMGNDNQMDMRGQNFQLIPFGTGRRMCPGASLALQVVPVNLASLIQCFEWKVDEGIVNMEEKPSLTLQMAHPLICVPMPRFSCIPSSISIL